MPTQATNQGQFIRWVKKYGDPALLLSFSKLKYLKRLLKKDKTLPLSILGDSIQFIIYLFAGSLSCIYRYKHGIQTVGFLSNCYFISVLILVFNAANVSFWLKPIIFWVAPLSLLKYDLITLVFKDIHSIGLAIYAVVCLLLNLYHTVSIHIGKGNKSDTRRGESWLYELVFIRFGLKSDYLVQGWIEPIITALIAWAILGLGDTVFGAYLLIAAVCMSLQENLDKAKQIEVRTSTT